MSPASPLPSALPSPLPSPLTSPSDATPSAICGYFLFPLLNAVLQTNIIQRVCVSHISLTYLHFKYYNIYLTYSFQQASILNLMKQAADFAGSSNYCPFILNIF